MKRKNLFFYALLAVATLGFASCSECDDPPEPAPECIYDKTLIMHFDSSHSGDFEIQLYTLDDRNSVLRCDARVTFEMYSDNQLIFNDYGNGPIDSFTMFGMNALKQSYVDKDGVYYYHGQTIYVDVPDELTTTPCEYEFALKLHTLMTDTYYLTPRYRIKVWRDEVGSARFEQIPITNE
ncbi:MAG: hypothetical protein RSB29_05245 [Alistipes sp.]